MGRVLSRFPGRLEQTRPFKRETSGRVSGYDGHPMKMRQSIAELEREFLREIHRDRSRRSSLHDNVELRAERRRIERQSRKGSMRFFLLSLTIIATAILVTIAMFKTLYIVMG
jgi:hypothetical protein